MRGALQADYVRTAHARGLSEQRIVWVHALRNVMVPVVTMAALELGDLISSAVVVEMVFAWARYRPPCGSRPATARFPLASGHGLHRGALLRRRQLGRRPALHTHRPQDTSGVRGARPWLGVAGGVLLVMAALLAIMAPVVSPYRPTRIDLRARLQPPAWEASGHARHPLGTDNVGRDVLSRIIWGARISVSVGAGAALLGAVAGSTLGLCAGFFGGRTDTVVSWLIEVQLALSVHPVRDLPPGSPRRWLRPGRLRAGARNLGEFRPGGPQPGAQPAGAGFCPRGPCRGHRTDPAAAALSVARCRPPRSSWLPVFPRHRRF